MREASSNFLMPYYCAADSFLPFIETGLLVFRKIIWACIQFNSFFSKLFRLGR